MFNKQVLSRITSALNSAKAPAKKKDIIVDPRGQWDHPGQPTRIPANEITMRGVPYPVMAYPDNGQPQLMYPDQEYSFPGAKYVDEYPQMNRMRNGGTLPQAQKGITISDYNDYVYRKAAYDDSLYLYKQNNSKLPSKSVFKYSPSPTHPNGINRPAIKVKQNPRKIIKSKDDQMRGLYFAKYFPTETPIYKDYYNKTGKKLPTNLPVWLDSQTAYQYPHFKYTNKYPNGYGYIKPGEKLEEQIEYAGRWKKPVQPVYFGKTDPILNSNNTNPFLTRPEAEIKTKEEPVEEIGRLPLKPLTEIPTKYSTKGYTPNASYLNTKKNTIKPPASATQWVQNPKTGTWHQIERPLHPALLPTYNVHTGSYKQRGGDVLPKAVNGTPTCPEGYTFDLATKSCIPSGEFEYIEDANDQRYKNYLLQNNLYNYSQLPNYYQKESLDYEDIISGNFNKPWQDRLTDIKKYNFENDYDYHYLKNNDLIGWEGSQAQKWDLTPKELNKFKNNPQFTWKPNINYTWNRPEGAAILKQFPPISYQGHGDYTAYPYAPRINYNPNVSYGQLNYYKSPNTQFIEDVINRKKLKTIYPTLSDADIDKHIQERRNSPEYTTNYLNKDRSQYIFDYGDVDTTMDSVTGLHPKKFRITPEMVADPYANGYINELPKKGADSYLQEDEIDNIQYSGSYIPMWGKPLKRYVLRDEVIKPIDNEPVIPSTILKEPEEQKITEPTQKAVPRTMRVPVEGVEEYWVYDKRLGYSVKRQRPKVTYREVPYTDEAPGSQDYNIQTGTPEVNKQKEGGVLPKAQIGKDVQSTAISAQDYMDAYNHAIALENYMKNRLDYHSIEPGKNSYYGGDIPSSEMIYNDLNSNFNRWTDPKRQYPRNIIRNNIMTEEVLQKDIPILDYYQQIDENKFRQRELLDGTIDMDFPMGYYDKRIPISQIKEYYSNDPDMHNGVTIPMYDQHYLKDEMIKSDPNIQYDESGKAFIPQKKQVTAAPNKGLILPESTLKWVQNPQTGTWHQIQRPQDTNLTPVYDINTGSNNKQKQGGSLLTKKVTCKKCGWEWDAADGGDDVTTCHKCGGQGLIHAQNGISTPYYSYNNEEPTSYDPITQTVNFNEESLTPPEGFTGNLKQFIDDEYRAQNAHENFHHWQNQTGQGRIETGRPDAVPTFPSNQKFEGDHYYNRREIEEKQKADEWRKAHPNESSFINPDILYNKVTNAAMYDDSTTLEGQARLIEEKVRENKSHQPFNIINPGLTNPWKKQGGTNKVVNAYSKHFQPGGFQDDLDKNRKVFEDWTYGKDLGMTYLPKAQNGITISDPKEYAYRNKMYTDSLNLYNAYKMQDKLMGLYSGTSKDKYKWNTAELKKGRKKNMVPGISYPIADDYQNEKEQFKDGFNLSARPQDLKLIKYYKSLGFTDKDIMYHSSPDVVSDKIRAVGTYNDGTAASPIYRKPKQKVTFGPNNVLPVEEKLELKTKPLQFIDTNRDIQDIVPNADYLKQYLQTRSANAIVPPASTLKWVQHPQTGTWYQIERPKNTMLTPEYNIRTGSYKKQ